MSIGRNGLYIYSSNLLNMIFGYVFWLLIANYSGAEGPANIGLVSAAVSFSTVLASLMLLGIPSGIQKFIGKDYSERNFESIASLISGSLMLTLILAIFSSMVIVLFGQEAVFATKLPWEFLIGSIILLLALVIQQLLTSSLIAISKSHFLLWGAIMQNASKVIIVIFFLTHGYGLTSLLIGYVASTILSLPILSIGIINQVPKTWRISSKAEMKTLLKASSVSWIPNIVSTIGGQLSVLIVLGYSGAGQAGEYYIASMIFSAVIAVPMGIINAAFPVLSAMNGDGKILISRIIRIGLMFSGPLSIIAAIYAMDFVTVLNPHFANTSLPIMLFMVAATPSILNYSIYYLLYARGKYRNVLLIGLAENVTKVVLYFALVPGFGSIGAVVSFIAGPLLAVLVITLTQRKYYVIPWDKVFLTIAIPLGIGIISYVLKLHAPIGIAIISLGSFYLYVKLAMVSPDELREMTFSILPRVIAKRVYPKMEIALRVISPKSIFSDS